MTDDSIIGAIANLRSAVQSTAIACDQRTSASYKAAALEASYAAECRAQVAEYSAILRQIDPEHADDYPDLQPTTGRFVSELRALTDILDQAGVLTAMGGVYVEFHLRDVQPDRARAFAEQVRASDPESVKIGETDRHLEILYGIGMPDNARFSLDLAEQLISSSAAVEEHEALADRGPCSSADVEVRPSKGSSGDPYDWHTARCGTCGWTRTGVLATVQASAAAHLADAPRLAQADDDNYRNHLGDEPEFVPAPFVQATPAEVAQAYTDSARHAALIRRRSTARREFVVGIEVDQRVRVHSSIVASCDFPAEYEGREGVVVKVWVTAPAGEGDKTVEILLDGASEPRCFAIAEVTVLAVPLWPAGDDKPLIGGAR